MTQALGSQSSASAISASTTRGSWRPWTASSSSASSTSSRTARGRSPRSTRPPRSPTRPALLGRVDAVTIADADRRRTWISRCRSSTLACRCSSRSRSPRHLQAPTGWSPRPSARGTLLAIGHTERFNPAVAAALPLVSEPRFIEIHRLGTFPERSLDIDVDLRPDDPRPRRAAGRRALGGRSVEAVGVNVLTPRADIANARLRFASGCIANVTASRISRDRVRKARFFQRTLVRLDRLRGAGGRGVPPGAQNGGRPAIEGGRLECANDEPLRRELADFVDAVRRTASRRDRPRRARRAGAGDARAEHERLAATGRGDAEARSLQTVSPRTAARR